MSATISRRALDRHAFRYERMPGDLPPGITLAELRRRRAAAARRRCGVLGRLRRRFARRGGR